MIKFVFATHNAHKVSEVRAIMQGLDIEIVSLSEINILDDITEDGATLEENAWIKADYIHNRLGGNVIAEDTGLEVSALGGSPGVYSARFAGPHRSAADNMTKLLSLLEQQQDRSGQFRTVLATWIKGTQCTFEGIVRGDIAKTQTGTGGFGYDPIFIPEGYNRSFGVLSGEIKNKISHRGRAFEQLRNHLNT